jgi:hypothetical protein
LLGENRYRKYMGDQTNSCVRGWQLRGGAGLHTLWGTRRSRCCGFRSSNATDSFAVVVMQRLLTMMKACWAYWGCKNTCGHTRPTVIRTVLISSYWTFFIYFFNHFAKSYDCVKIYQIWQSTVVATTFMTKLSWRTAVGGRPRRLATAHGGWEVKTLWATLARPNRRDPRRLGPF